MRAPRVVLTREDVAVIWRSAIGRRVPIELMVRMVRAELEGVAAEWSRKRGEGSRADTQ